MKTFQQWIEAHNQNSIQWEYEDTAHDRDLEFDIYYSIDPGEEMVRYYPGGGGHPGSSTQIDITKVVCTKVTQYDPVGNISKSGPPHPHGSILGDQFDELIQKDTNLKNAIEEKILDSQKRGDERDYDDRY